MVKNRPFCWSIWNALFRAARTWPGSRKSVCGSDCDRRAFRAETESKAGADAVAADVEQVEGEVVVVEPVVAERVAAQLGRGDEPPVGPDRRPS